MSELDLDTLQRWAATAPDSGVLLHVSDGARPDRPTRTLAALLEQLLEMLKPDAAQEG
jgi:hypothetical protein